MGIMEHEGVNF